MKRLLLVLTAALSTGVQAAPASDYSVTIYSRAQPGAVDPGLYRPGERHQTGSIPGYAVVRQTHSRELDQGGSEVRIQDVASLIDPTTVNMRSLGTNDVRVLEQNFEFDLVSSAKLLNRYLDRQVTVTRNTGSGDVDITGTLLSTDGGLVLRRSNGSVQIVRDYDDVKLPALPGGLITRPTLVWQIQSGTAGTKQLQISYQTDGMTWWADYNATLEEDDKGWCKLDLNAWVSIVNQSGAGYPDSDLKLIAGDVQRISPDQPEVMMEMAGTRRSARDSGFQEKSFFEYHLYTLPRKTSLPDNSTKQLELFPTARNVPCTKEYVFDSRRHYPGYHSEPFLDRRQGPPAERNVAVFLAFRNDERSRMGMPLPAGRVRINKQDSADGSLEFIGEDVIDHTPKNESIRVGLGNAFDIVAERRHVDYRVDTSSKTLHETFEIEVRNHKETPVTVRVNEAMYRWINWEIVDSSHDFEKLDARSVRFPVEVDSDGTTTLRYEVRYTW